MRERFRASSALIVALSLAAPACLKVPEEFSDEPSGPVTAPTTAAEVLERYVAAIGGEEVVRQAQARTVEARVVVHAEDGCDEDDDTCMSQDQTGSFVFVSTEGGRLYQRTVIGESVEEHGFDGKTGWALLDGALRIDTPEEAAASREESLLHWYLDLDDRDVEVALLPSRKEDSQGKVVTLDGLTWTTASNPDKEMWFDRSTGLLHEEIVRDGAGEVERTQIVTYADYRPVDDILVAHEIHVFNSLGDRTQELEFLTQSVNHSEVDATRFEVPTLAPPKPKPDPLLARLAQVRREAAGQPSDEQTQLEWARIAYQAGRFEESEEALAATLKLAPKEPEALLTLARIQVLRNDDTALKTLSRAARAGVREDVIAKEESWLHLRSGRFDKLAKALDAAGNPVLAGRYRAFVGKPNSSSLSGCTVEIPMVQAQPLVVIPVEIGGREVEAILDTGAGDLIVGEALAEQAKVAVHARTPIAEGLPDVGHGELDELRVGELVVSHIPANVFDDRALSQMADRKAVRAVVGTSMFRDYLIEVDTANKRVRLASRRKACQSEAAALTRGPSVSLWLHETHYLYARARMNEAEGIYLINTGMRGADVAANQFANEHAGIGMPPLRDGETPIATVEQFSLGELELTNLSQAYGLFQQAQTSGGFRLDGMIGMGVVGQQRFVLDYDGLRMYFPE